MWDSIICELATSIRLRRVKGALRRVFSCAHGLNQRCIVVSFSSYVAIVESFMFQYGSKMFPEALR